MARAICSSCGLRSQHCQCRLEVSTARNTNGDDVERDTKLSRASFCKIYLVTAIVVSGFYLSVFFWLEPFIYGGQPSCPLEVLVGSFSISNVSNATADWNVSFVTRSPGNSCQVSLHIIKSRLIRDGNLISESFTPDYFGKLVNGQMNETLSYAVFKTVATTTTQGNSLVWDLRVNVVSSFTGLESPGFLNVNCDGIPVNFTVDSTGNVKGSLLGRMRPCEYLVRSNYTDTTF